MKEYGSTTRTATQSQTITGRVAQKEQVLTKNLFEEIDDDTTYLQAKIFLLEKFINDLLPYLQVSSADTANYISKNWHKDRNKLYNDYKEIQDKRDKK